MFPAAIGSSSGCFVATCRCVSSVFFSCFLGTKLGRDCTKNSGCFLLRHCCLSCCDCDSQTKYFKPKYHLFFNHNQVVFMSKPNHTIISVAETYPLQNTVQIYHIHGLQKRTMPTFFFSGDGSIFLLAKFMLKNLTRREKVDINLTCPRCQRRLYSPAFLLVAPYTSLEP